MCGILGAASLNGQELENDVLYNVKNALKLIKHRGPDAEGIHVSTDKRACFAHVRLSIIDLRQVATQPLIGGNKNFITYNGEIYNYKDLQNFLSGFWSFRTNSDTETILAAYSKYGVECVNSLRGMFAFALWDESHKTLFCARDRFGIKPFYYTIVEDTFFFASEIKALLPFIREIHINKEALLEYLTFQYTLGEHTLFAGIKQLMPGHYLTIENGQLEIYKYWDVNYEIDYDHSPRYFEKQLGELLSGSVRSHLVSDVPIGSYLSGGLDSSLITCLAAENSDVFYGSFHGKFTEEPGYDESSFAHATSDIIQKPLYEISISSHDFIENIKNVIYHLDTPTAGPGSFPQYMVSKLASQHVKVVLGGQGGDEIFGGYARYIIAYFEQSIKAAIDGTYKNGNFVVTPESIIPNLTILQEYKPLLKEFWREGLFGAHDERYFRLISRSTDVEQEINWQQFNLSSVVEKFKCIFNNHTNVRKEAYFDKMTHFDFKCLLPALLQVEDRMSMAHGLESRVPFLDHPLVELAATIPANIKFPGGQLKHLLKTAFHSRIPENVLKRRDKMGFPVPLKEWFAGPLKNFIYDIFSTENAKTRGFYDPLKVLDTFDKGQKFSRKAWGLLSLELWFQAFHDQHQQYKQLAA